MENIIKKAIKGGWDGSDEYGGEYTMDDYLYSKEKILFDPLFWQALSRACQWGEFTYKDNLGSTKHVIVWKENAKYFFNVCMDKGFNIAVEWLEEKIK